MMNVRSIALVWSVVFIGGCAATPSSLVPASAGDASATTRGTYHAADSASALPGDGASALPGDGASALPGDGASALPGDGASALPGASPACALQTQQGTMACTIAINVTIAPIASPQTPASLVPGLHPSDLNARYGLGEPSAPTIAIVDAYDDPAAESDLAVYRTTFGLSPCTRASGCLTEMNQRGATALPSPNAAWAQETSLDLDMVSAACPNCHIVLVEADSASIDDLGAAVDMAVARGANAVSNSYYAAEWSGETGEDHHFDHPGVAVTASSGDAQWPAYPAASPYTIAVSGTSLSGGNETPWTYSGHGCSAYESAPHWQHVSTCATRDAVDVAAVADPQTGVAMFDSAAGGWLVAGGTSVGAPLVAAAYALGGNGANASFTYAHAGALHQLSAGYGSIVGLGSPDGLSAF